MRRLGETRAVDCPAGKGPIGPPFLVKLEEARGGLLLFEVVANVEAGLIHRASTPRAAFVEDARQAEMELLFVTTVCAALNE